MTEPPSRKRRKDMTPTELAHVRKLENQSRYARERGQPVIISDEEAQTLRAHLRSLRDAGMSGAEIARIAHIPDTTLNGFLNGDTKHMYRERYEVLMRMQPQATEESHGLTPAWRVRRRLQAMCADGFTYKVLAEQLDTTVQEIWGLTTDHPDWSYQKCKGHTLVKVKALYDKLAGADPRDHGVLRPSRPRNVSLKLGFAPSVCWDWDTIDDPSAIPQYTGQCGTTSGYNLHRNREVLPICQPCKDAMNTQKAEAKRKRKAAARKEQGQ